MALEEYGTGNCINCGYLCKQDRHETRSACYEATVSDRLNGRLTEVRGEFPASGGTIGKTPRVPTSPCCFINEANIQVELSDLETDENQANKVLQLIKKDRNCPQWYAWTQFRSPEKHFEEFKMMELERRREEFELKLEELNRQERKHSNRVMVWLTIAMILFAAMQVYAALALMNPEQWLFNWLR